MLLPCGTAWLAMLSCRAEPNSAVPRLMVSNGVLLPCLNRDDNFSFEFQLRNTAFGTGLFDVFRGNQPPDVNYVH